LSAQLEKIHFAYLKRMNEFTYSLSSPQNKVPLKYWLAILALEARFGSTDFFQEFLRRTHVCLHDSTESSSNLFEIASEMDFKDFETSPYELSEFIRGFRLSQTSENTLSLGTKKAHERLLEKIESFDLESLACKWQKYFEAGLRLSTFWCADYPKTLRAISFPPVCLTYFGLPTWNQNILLSVVGSREPSVASKQWLELNLPELIKKDIRFVSGGARGVDQISHESCWLRNHSTYVFLPSGLLKPYPQEWLLLKEDVLKSQGAILSEYLPDATIQKAHFWQRNRLISGISKLTLIVEARRKSGTLLTAKHALEQNRELAVVPHVPVERGALGSLDLLFDGANLVRDYKDVLSLMGCQID